MTQVVAALLIAAGIVGLYRAWQDRRAAATHRRALVTASWLTIVAGIAFWCLVGNADIAISQAVVVVMLMALVAIATHALFLRREGGGGRNGGAAEPLARRANISNRLARLVGSFAVVPLLGLVAGLLWFAWMPGLEANRMMGMAFTVLTVAATGFVVLLASTRPARMVLVLCALTLVMAGALLPALAR